MRNDTRLLDGAKPSVSEDTINTFIRDGVVLIPNLFNVEQLKTLEAGIQSNLSNPSIKAKILTKSNDTGFFIEDFCNWQDNTYYKDFIFNSPMGVTAHLLLRSQTVRLYHDHLLVKTEGTSLPTPWHQDEPYYNISGSMALSFWIPIDSVPKAHSLKFVAGSHHGPLYLPRTFRDKKAKWFKEGTLLEVPDVEKNPKDFNLVSFEVSPGDVICFHMRTLHASPQVKHNLRRVFSVRVLGDDIRHLPRPWITSPNFDGLEKELAAGAMMDHPLFPILHQI